MPSKLLYALLLLLLAACGGGRGRAALCQKHFAPYADIVGDGPGDARSSGLAASMAHYREGRYAEAEQGLTAYINSRRDFQRSALLYLAVSQLANGKPYEAELSIDKLEHSNVKGFADQCGWYTVLCWLCSEQWARALEGARAIAAAPRHTYKREAAALAGDLERFGTE